MSEQVNRLKLEAVGLDTWKKAAKELERMNKSVLPGTVSAFAKLDASGKKLTTNITFLSKEFQAFGISVQHVNGGMSVSAKETTALNIKLAQLAFTAERVAAAFDAMASKQKLLGGPSRALVPVSTFNDASKATQNLGANYAQLGRQSTQLVTQTGALQTSNTQLVRAYISTDQAGKRVYKTINGLLGVEKQHNKQTEQTTNSTHGFSSAVQHSSQRLLTYEKTLKTAPGWVRNLAFAQRQHGNIAEKAAKQVTLSYTSIMRLVQVQILHRIFASLARFMRESVTEAVALSKAVAEVRTISYEANTSTQDWINSLEQLSNQFGRNMAEVAEGAYQALSNQVMQSAEDLRFLNEMLKLSAVSVSTLDQSVGATTAIINAFDMEMSAVNRVAGVLFKTVELGRVRMEEMADSLGRVSMLSGQLGISFEEQQAAFTTLTIQGVKFNVAQTLLSNVLLKLIKPSEHMMEIFERWGVSSGKAAVETYGFAGVMNKLYQEAEKSKDMMEELGDQWGRLRAITGAAGIIFNLEQFDQDTAEMLESYKTYEQRFDEVMKSLGKRWEIQTTRMKNVFIQDFGTNIANAIVTLGEKWGGLDNVIRQVIDALKALGITTLAYMSYTKILIPILSSMAHTYLLAVRATVAKATAVHGLSTATWSLIIAQRALMPFLAPALLLGASYAIVKIAGAWKASQQEITNYIAELKATLDTQTQLHEATWDREVELSKQKYTKQRQQLMQFLAILKQEYRKAYEALDKNVANHVNQMKLAWADMSQQVADDLDKINGIMKDAVAAQKEIAKIAADLQLDIDIRGANFTDLTAEAEKAKQIIENLVEAIAEGDKIAASRSRWAAEFVDANLQAQVEAQFNNLTKIAKDAWADANAAIEAGNVKVYNAQLARMQAAEEALKKHIAKLASIEKTQIDTRITALATATLGAWGKKLKPGVQKLIEDLRNTQLAALSALKEGDLLGFSEAQERAQRLKKELEAFPNVFEKLQGTAFFESLTGLIHEDRVKAETELNNIINRRVKMLDQELANVQKGAEVRKAEIESAKQAKILAESIKSVEESKKAFTDSEKESLQERTNLLQQYWKDLVKAQNIAKQSDPLLADRLQVEKKRALEISRQLLDLEDTVKAEEQLAKLTKEIQGAEETSTASLEARESFQKQINAQASKAAETQQDFLMKRQLVLENLRQEELAAAHAAALGGGKTSGVLYDKITAEQKRTLELQKQVDILKEVAEAEELTVEEATEAAEATKKLLQYQLDVARTGKLPEGVLPEGMIIEQFIGKTKEEISAIDKRLEKLLDLDKTAGDASATTAALIAEVNRLKKAFPELAAEVEKRVAEENKITSLVDIHNKSIKAVSDGLFKLAEQLEGFPNANAEKLASGGLVTGRGGIDRIPAMLTAGEYVWDKATTRRFLPVIQGLQQASKTSASPLTTNYGGINVTVHGADSPQLTAKTVVQHLKRELRKGTVTL